MAGEARVELIPVFERFNRDINKTIRSLKDTARSTDKVDKEMGQLSKQANATSNTVVKGTSRMRRAFNRVRTSVRGVGGAISGLAVGAFLGTAVKSANDFEKALANVLTLNPTSSIEQFKDQAKVLSETYGKSATDQVDAFYKAVSFGFTDIESSTELLERANRLAVGGLTDVETATSLLAGTIRAYGFDASEAERVSDVLFTTVRLGNTTMEELASGMGNITPLAAKAGVTIEELGAAVSVVTANGIDTRKGINGLRTALGAVLKPTQEASQAAADLGIEFGPDAIKKAGGFIPFLQGIAKATEGNTGALTALFPQVEGLPAILSVLSDDAEGVTKALEEMEKATGATSEAFEKQDTTTASSLAKTTQRIANLKIEIGEGLQPVLLAILEPINKFTDRIKSLSDEEKSIAGITVGLGLLALAVAALSAPVLIVIGVIGAITALFIYWEDLMFELEAAWTFFAADFPVTAAILEGAVSLIGDAFKIAFELASGVVETAWNIISIPFKLIGQGISTLLDLVEDFGVFFEEVFSGDVSIGEAFSNLAGNLFDTFADAFKGIGDIFLAPIKSAINTVAGLIENLVNRTITGVNFIPGVNIDKIQIPRLQTGGSINGPGTGTSDSILARLSDGEFVINAKSANKLGLPLLDSLNKYANGGPVGFQRGGLASSSISEFAGGEGGVFDVVAAQEWIRTFGLVGTQLTEGSNIVTGIRNRLSDGYDLESEEIQKLVERLDGLIQTTKDTSNAAGGLASSLSQGIVDVLSGRSDKSLGDVFKDSLQNYFLKKSQKALEEGFNNLFNSLSDNLGKQGGGGGGGGILGNIFGSFFSGAPGFNKGGVVPGIGNTDTVPALLTPGETVIPKGQSGSTNIYVTNNISAPLGVDENVSRFIAEETERTIAQKPNLVNSANNTQNRRNRTFGGR